MNILNMFEILNHHYGDQHWWPADTPYEVMVGAVLTQNTNWSNVEKALARFGGELSPELVASMPLSDLSEIIRPAGFFNQKAMYLKALTAWFARYSYSVEAVRAGDFAQLRQELLAVRGIGPETADSILLYAFLFPSFVIDAYTLRLCSRIPIDVGTNYAVAKSHFESALPADADLFNQYHALVVTHGKTHCQKRPLCTACPLETHCLRVGIE